MLTTCSGPLERKVLKCGIKGPTPEESYKILIDIMRIVNISEAELIVYGGKYIAVKGSGKDSEIVGLDEDPYKALEQAKANGVYQPLLQRLPTWKYYKHRELEAELYKLYRELFEE